MTGAALAVQLTITAGFMFLALLAGAFVAVAEYPRLLLGVVQAAVSAGMIWVVWR